MSIWESQVRGLGDTSDGEASAKQKSEEGAGTQNNDDPHALPGLEAGLDQQARDDDKDLHEKGRDAEADGEAEDEEQKQRRLKEEEEEVEEEEAEDEDDEEAKATEGKADDDDDDAQKKKTMQRM